MPDIKLTRDVVMGGKIHTKGSVITVSKSLKYESFGELVSQPKKSEEPAPEPKSEPKRSRTKPEAKPEPEVTEDGAGDNP